MPRLQILFECVVRALCEAAGPGGGVATGESLLAMVRSVHQQVAERFSDEGLRDALREAVAAPQDTFDLVLEDAVTSVAGGHPAIRRKEIGAMLDLIQPVIRQALRRPGDAAGSSVPQSLRIGKPNDWLIFFPDRPARFKAGEAPPAYGDWQLTDLRGLGPFGEAWQGLSEEPAEGAACLKFITDRRGSAEFSRYARHFRRIAELKPTSGLVPLRSVHLRADPPCLVSAFVSGYDVASLIRDWRWRDERPRPEHAAMIVKRVARIVGGLHLHDPPVVHRGLKPSNILLHPTADGRVTVWVSDLGWGEISSTLALSSRDFAQAKRQARRGSLATLYASPEQRDGRAADPRDDVYALGAIWHQLLRGDLRARVPEGNDWAMDFRKAGLTDAQARVLASCIDPNPARRPDNGLALAAMIDANLPKLGLGKSRTVMLQDDSTAVKKPEK